MADQRSRRRTRRNALETGGFECNDKIKNTESLVETYAKTDKLIGDKLGEIESKLAEVEKLRTS